MAFTFSGSTFTLQGTYTPSGSPSMGDIYSDGTYIYVTDSAGKVYALTFSGTTWTLKGTLTPSFNPYGINGDGTYIYVGEINSSSNSPLVAAYTFNGTTFTLAGAYNATVGNTSHRSIYVNGGIIYVMNNQGGLTALTFDGTTFHLLGHELAGQNSNLDNFVTGDGSYLYTGVGLDYIGAFPICH